MKKLLLIFKILLIPIISINETHLDVDMDLKTAAQSNIIHYTMKGNGKSPHYIHPLTINIVNLKNYPVTIHVSNGMQFIAKDSIYQNFIITKEEIIALKPQEKKEIDLYAMCTQAHDRAPNDKTDFVMKKNGDTNLQKVTRMIEKFKCFETGGQYAIWALTDRYPLEDISGFDTAQASRLQKLVSKITGKRIPPPPGPNDYKRNYYCRTYVDKIGGKFEFDIYKEMEIRIAMFDSNGIVVRELYSKAKEPKGYHRFDFEFDASVYHDRYYHIKLLVDGNVKVSRKISTQI